MKNGNSFDGYYFKQTQNGRTLALIAGRCGEESFVQVAADAQAYRFSFPAPPGSDPLRAGGCRFGAEGVRLSLPQVQGELTYRALTPPRYDIMGPFACLPMECRHGIVSWRHEVYGTLTVAGTPYRFDGGAGYIERDSGRAFPRTYTWMQTLEFADMSIFLAVADIPLAGRRFTGGLAAVWWQGREYRLATYLGASARADAGGAVLWQPGRAFSAEILRRGTPCALDAPVAGRMSGRVGESNNAAVRFRLWDRGRLLFERRGEQVSLEQYVRPAEDP